jgi:hypothetical protein
MEMANWLADSLARWLRGRMGANPEGRRNFRLVCAPATLRERLQNRLDAEPGGQIQWFVREASAEDAVQLRHGRPTGLREELCIGYVLLWLEGATAADRNAQSLRDIAPFDVADILTDLQFEVPFEQAIKRRCEEAAQAWEPSLRPRVKEHLVAAWEGLRRALRLAPQHSDQVLRLVDNLERWGDFLHRCQVSDAEWESWPIEQRAELLMARLGGALPALGLFTLPALGSVLGVTTNPKVKPESPRRTGEKGWDAVLEEILMENFHWASDPGDLADTIAGKRTFKDQIDTLVRSGGVRLAGAGDSGDAASALERFCRDHDLTALNKVEWLFYEDPHNRRSRSMGLNGLLIARGRREARAHPLDKLAEETVSALAQYLTGGADACRPLVQDARGSVSGRQQLAVALAELAGMGRRELSTEWRKQIDTAAALQEGAADTLRALSGRWAAVDAEAAPDEIKERSLLLGLARLLSMRAEEEGQPGAEGTATLELALIESPAVRTSFAVDATLPERLRTWMKDKVREALEEPEVTDGELDERETDGIAFSVSRVSGQKTEKLGTVQVVWTAADREVRRGALGPVLRCREQILAEGRRVPSGMALLRLGAAMDAQPGPGAASLGDAWRAYVKDLGFDQTQAPTPRLVEIFDLVAPVGASARRFVEAWQAEVEQAAEGANQEQRQQKIQKLMADALEAFKSKDYARGAALSEAADQLKQEPAGPVMSLADVRRLLAVETWRVAHGADERVVLSPHHPLVLRLRGLADTLLSEIIEALWKGAWPQAAREDLKDALDGWELPEPQHVYGFQPPAPLVFDGWVSGHAVYTQMGSNRDTDARALGLNSTREVVARFSRLFPAAADRLRMRIHGDADCRWAWALFSGAGGSAFTHADMDLVTDVPSRTQTAFEAGALSSGDGLMAYEPGPDGTIPARRFRRVQPNEETGAEVHLSLLLADRLAAFSAGWADAEGPKPTAETWDTRLFFHEARPETVDYRLVLGERPDALSWTVSRAVARACGRESPFRESFSFDPATIGPVLRQEQRRGKWLVLVSRQPAYRAVQACGDIATLLDFSSRVEGGRPVHVAVSLGEERHEECAASLGRTCMAVLGSMPVSADTLLARARVLAPGLALQALCSSQIALEGLLGLLLTQSQVSGERRLVLSLDQHQRLLGGSGILADLLVLSDGGDGIQLAVSESKFTTLAATTSSEPVMKALKQVRTTTQRLDRFGIKHPLAARTRASMVRAAVQQIHLLDRALSVEKRQELSRLVDRLEDPNVPFTVLPVSKAAVHIWSWDSRTIPGSHVLNEIPTFVHDRQETVEALRRLAL